MQRTIVGFHRDDEGFWVAELDCGHNQHVRHRPPFELKPWVLDDESRNARVGTERDCPLCDREGGESSCYAHLVCEECGVVLDGSAHREGCSHA